MADGTCQYFSLEACHSLKNFAFGAIDSPRRIPKEYLEIFYKEISRFSERYGRFFFGDSEFLIENLEFPRIENFKEGDIPQFLPAFSSQVRGERRAGD